MWRAALLLSLAAGCFSPNVEDGAECSPEGGCPPGQTCAADGRCYRESPSFLFRRRIDIHPLSISQVLRDYPMAVVLTGDQGLADHARDDGLDIHFTEGDGATELAFEVEELDPDAGDLVAWVRVPLLSFEDTIYLHYGGEPFDRPPPASVWHERYLAVWHGAAASDPGILADSTANQNQGESAADQAPARVEGVAGPALSFDGVDDQVQIDEAVPLVVLDPQANLLVTMWARVTGALGENDAAIGKGAQSGSSPGFGLQLGKTTWIARLRGSAGSADTVFASFGAASELTGRWVLLGTAITHDSGGEELFPVVTTVDGEDVGLGYWLCQAQPCGFDLGGSLFLSHPDARFRGLIDEIRVVDRTAGGENQRAEFENLSDPDSFYTVAGEETLPR
jgi:hypothetical protein